MDSTEFDFSWMKAPPVLSVSNAENLKPAANTPMGHRTVEVEKRYEDIEYLPATPHLSGMYVFADLVYPAIGLSFSMFELYHAEVGVTLRPKLYITPRAVIGVNGVPDFERSKPAHRLIWINDDAAAIKFVDFISSYMFTRRARREVSSVQASVLPLRYPADDEIDRKVHCTYLVPFNTKGGYEHDQMGSVLSPYPLFSWQAKTAHSGAQSLATQAEALWQSS